MRALVGLIAAVTVGCFKGAVPPPPVTPPPVQPKPVQRTAMGDALEFLPADAQLVAVVDLKELRTSVVWRRVEPTLRKKIEDGSFKNYEKCQLDLIASPRRISVAIRDWNATPSGVVVIHGLRRDPVMTCLASAPGVKIDRGIATVTTNGTAMALSFADDATLVLQFGPQADAAALAATLDAGAPLRMTPAFSDLLGMLEPSHPMWLVVADGSVFKGQTAGMNAKAFVASAKVGDSANVHFRLRLDDPAAASTLATQIQAQIGTLSSMFDELTANADDVDMILTAKMSSSQLDAMLGLIGPSLGIP